jgi:hypothetical protein
VPTHLTDARAGGTPGSLRSVYVHPRRHGAHPLCAADDRVAAGRQPGGTPEERPEEHRLNPVAIIGLAHIVNASQMSYIVQRNDRYYQHVLPGMSAAAAEQFATLVATANR